MTVRSGETAVLDWATAEQPLGGNAPCGDAACVAENPSGTLVAVVDGLGHGPAAASASEAAVRALEESAGSPVEVAIARCHERMARTRGGVLSIAQVGPASLSWAGVGNVEGLLVRAGQRPERLLLWGGVVGHNLPRIRVSSLPFETADLLLFWTDGITLDSAEQFGAGEPLTFMVERLFQRGYRGRDDGLVLAARRRPPP